MGAGGWEVGGGKKWEGVRSGGGEVETAATWTGKRRRSRKEMARLQVVGCIYGLP